MTDFPELVGKVAVRLGLGASLSAEVSARIEESVEDAEAKVENYLHRPLVAVERTATGLWPDLSYPLLDHRAWPQAKALYDDRYRVVSHTGNVEYPETFDVTFMVGLDVANDRELKPILRFIAQDAAAQLAADLRFTVITRAVKSVSAEGQSVSYVSENAAEGSTGGALKLDSLARWKRHAIYQSPTQPLRPWPYR